MPSLPSSPAVDLRPQRFSYIAIGGASLFGLVFPGAIFSVLGPVVLVGLLFLGLAHGACDQHVLPAVGQVRHGKWGYLVRFVAGYLGLVVVAGLGWWQWPRVAVSLFFLLTVWHWGSADAPAHPTHRLLWLVHSVLRGTLLFAVPVQCWPVEVQQSVNGLLVFAGAAPLAATSFAWFAAGLWPVVAGGHLLLWGCYAAQRQPRRWLTDMGEVGLLLGLFSTLPPLLALGVYFVFWHSLQHILRLNRVFGYTAAASQRGDWAIISQEVAFFIRRALPSLLMSLLVPAVLYLLLPANLAGGDMLLSIAVVSAAILTLPHALLVSVALDAAHWRVPAVSAGSAGPVST